jgi:2-polyprenyl-3-methyl-5-hydroxy-6-metoxy-1,4-benzoquinol methylase
MRESAFDEFSAREPYFAALTDPRFLRANLTPAHEREFFGTGEALVDWMFAIIEAGLVPGFAPVAMLEYGCGPGRLAIPLSRRAGSVTAIDRSPPMLEIARREAERRGAGHIAFDTPDAFRAQSRKFDLVVCYHVLQRLPRREGLSLVEELVNRIGPGGVGVFQWLMATGASAGKQATRWAREHLPAVNSAVNRLRKKPSNDPFIPTHPYALDDLLSVLRAAGCRGTHVVFEESDGLDYAIAFARKPGTTLEARTTAPSASRTAARSAAVTATDAEIDAFNRAAESYYAKLSNWDHHLAKPFGQIAETPAILANLAVILHALKLSPGLRVLDFGAGSGWLSRCLTQLGCQVTLLDVSPTALDIARALYARHPVVGSQPAPQFLVFDGRQIDLPDASVDRIVCFDAFHHSANPDAVIREFARLLVPGGLAGFAEPGPRHSESARSSFESDTFGVVERDLDVHALWRTAQAAGFADLRMCVFHEPLYQVSMAEYEDLATGGPAGARWLDATRKFLHLTRDFVLVKGGDVRADSRTAQGLACEIRPAEPHMQAQAGALITIDLIVTNTGLSWWLPSDAPIGGVSLGAHLYESQGTLLNFDAGRTALTSPPRTMAPNEAVSCRLTLPGLDAGRYRVEIDCVAERVTWFAQAGSPPAVVTLEILSK